MNLFEVKASFEIADEGTITGLAWPFGSPDRVGDMIEKGAFSATMPLPILFAHDPALPVGAWVSAIETEAGLEVRGRLLIDEVEKAREVYALVKAGAVRGLSIGFETKKARSRKGGGRTITSLNLVEISLVTVPMHPGARVISAKNVGAAMKLADAINRTALAMRA